MSFWEAISFYISGGSLGQVLQWWAVLFGIGLLFLPICFRLFRSYFDKGYTFSKVLGMMSAVYITWLLASLKIAQFSQRTCIFVVIMIGIAGLIAARGQDFKATIRQHLRIMLLEEGVFLGALLFWGFIRSLNPQIYGLEKFMDYGFMTSILNSAYMPPTDPWYSGSTINYYYFGHFTYAWLTILSGIKSAVAFNISVATIFAFSFSLVHSLAANLVFLRKDCTRNEYHAAGFISAVLFTLGGNLYTATYGFLLPILKIVGIYHGDLSSTYANATRFIGFFPPTTDKPITEFPSYSFVVADLHAHVMSIPIVLSILALCVVCIHSALQEKTSSAKWYLPYITLFPWLALLLAVTALTNAWTLPTGMLIICTVFGFARWRGSGKFRFGVLAFALTGFALVIATALLTLPFQMHFKNFSQGIRLSNVHTPFWQMLILWGYQMLVAGWFFIALLIKKRKSSLKLNASDYTAIAFVLCALVFIAIPEFIYVKDIYGYSFRRANTVFKLSYEAFILLTVLVGYFAVIIARRLTDSPRRMITTVILTMLLYLPMTFTWLAMIQGCKLPYVPRYWGLDGLAYMAKEHPGDYKAANWIMDNTPGNAKVLEAEGDSYTDYARISMMSGHQTILGWYVHEWLWRGDKKSVNLRRKDVKAIYEAKNSSEAFALLRKYDISYLVIGNLEIKRYPDISMSVLFQLGKTVFHSNNTLIIEVQSRNR